MATVTCPKCGRTLITESSDGGFMFCEYCGTKINLNINLNYNFNYSKSEHTEHIVDDAKIKAAENANRVIGIFASPFEERRRAKEEAKRQQEESIRRIHEEQQRQEEAKRERKERIMNGQYSFKEMLVDLFQSQTARGFMILFFMLFLCLGIGLYGEHQEKIEAHQARLEALEQEKIDAQHLAMNQAQIPEFDSTVDARTFVRDLKSHGFVNVTSEAAQDLILGINSKEYEIIEVLVDGAPDYSPDTWYPTDTDIVVRYHSYR